VIRAREEELYLSHEGEKGPSAVAKEANWRPEGKDRLRRGEKGSASFRNLPMWNRKSRESNSDAKGQKGLIAQKFSKSTKKKRAYSYGLGEKPQQSQRGGTMHRHVHNLPAQEGRRAPL